MTLSVYQFYCSVFDGITCLFKAFESYCNKFEVLRSTNESIEGINNTARTESFKKLNLQVNVLVNLIHIFTHYTHSF
ncbi:hypothetical protein EVA_13629 [gut metagenome]|uniref:Transposase n=1 Tax=gut metagenome TaxID=749906 RepID=J9FUT5_9ZZZZ